VFNLRDRDPERPCRRQGVWIFTSLAFLISFLLFTGPPVIPLALRYISCSAFCQLPHCPNKYQPSPLCGNLVSLRSCARIWIFATTILIPSSQHSRNLFELHASLRTAARASTEARQIPVLARGFRFRTNVFERNAVASPLVVVEAFKPTH
jgi:hypothetical protein